LMAGAAQKMGEKKTGLKKTLFQMT